MSFHDSYEPQQLHRCPWCNAWGCKSRGCLEAYTDELRVKNDKLGRKVRELRKTIERMAKEKRNALPPEKVMRPQPTAPTAPQRRHPIPVQEGWR